MLTKIDALQAQLINRLHPLPRNTLKSLHEQLVLEWTYNSNAIEGNTLTFQPLLTTAYPKTTSVLETFPLSCPLIPITGVSL